MTCERAERALEEFLRTRGLDRHKMQDLPDAQARQLGKEASAYATARLTELESRAHFVQEIHGTTQTG